MQNIGIAGRNVLKPWVDRLVSVGLVQGRGRTKGTTYRIAPEMIRHLKLKTNTTLKDIEPYRLRELVIADLQKYQDAAIGEIHKHIGSDIPRRNLQRTLLRLREEGIIDKTGDYNRQGINGWEFYRTNLIEIDKVAHKWRISDAKKWL